MSSISIDSTRVVMTALFVALITAGALFVCHLETVHLHQIFTGWYYIGSRLISVGIYIILGLIGVPVFTSGGGQAILQPTFNIWIYGWLI